MKHNFMIKFILIFFLFFQVNSVLAMAKTLIWQCQVDKVNNEKQSNGKINKYKIDVTTPMVWVGDETRWSGFENTKFLYDKNNHLLTSDSNSWVGIYYLIEHKIEFINNVANLKIIYECKEL
tara:strand:- start:2483 stop:2848 length:366 start_codon:yes stop_codon:yes gene_type:complete